MILESNFSFLHLIFVLYISNLEVVLFETVNTEVDSQLSLSNMIRFQTNLLNSVRIEISFKLSSKQITNLDNLNE